MNLETNLINKLKMDYGAAFPFSKGEKHTHQPKGEKYVRFDKGIVGLLLVLLAIFLLSKYFLKKRETKISEQYLPLKGGTMEGDVMVPSCFHVGVQDEPTEDTYAANKVYVDKQISTNFNDLKDILDEKLQDILDKTDKTFLPLAGGTMMGDVTFESGTLSTTNIPSEGTHVVNKAYLDKENETFKQDITTIIEDKFKAQYDKFLPIAGGTMKGNLFVPSPYALNIQSEPTTDLSGTNKLYVDSQNNVLRTEIKQEIINASNNTQALIDGLKDYNNKTFLPLAGGTMQGDIIFPADKTLLIPSLPILDAAATNKGYVDTLVANTIINNQTKFDELEQQIKDAVSDNTNLFLSLDGGTMKGPIVMSEGTNVEIFDVPLNDTSGVNKKYLDLKTGEFITYIDDSLNALETKNKTFITENISNTMDDLGKLYLPLTGGTMSGTITMDNSFINVEKPPSEGKNAANKAYVDKVILDNKTYIDDQIAKTKDDLKDDIASSKDTTPYLPLAGGTMSGPIIMANGKTVTIPGLPTSDTNAVNKLYVDSQITNLKTQVETEKSLFLPLTGGTMKGPIILPSGSVTVNTTPTLDAHAANKAYVDGQITALGTKFLPLSGGTMTGPIVMSLGTSITVDKAPTEPLDAVNKEYLDNKFIRAILQCKVTGVKANKVEYTLPPEVYIPKQDYSITLTADSFTISTTTPTPYDTVWRICLYATFTTDTTLTIGSNGTQYIFTANQTSFAEEFFTLKADVKTTTFSISATGSPVLDPNTTSKLIVIQLY